MNREDVLKSYHLKKRFCKDNNLPIKIYDNPYFEQRLDILNPLFGAMNKFNDFVWHMRDFNSEQDYFDYYNSVKDKIINDLKENPAFVSFINEDREPWAQQIMSVTKNIENRNLYSDDNNGKLFVSIDMKKANFSALKYYSSDIFGGAETWEEFIQKYTPYKCITESKYIRQVVMGACNPRAQITYEKYLISRLCEHIQKELGNQIKVLCIAADEIILTEISCGLNAIKEAVSSCSDNLGDLVRIEFFELNKLGNYGWEKIFNTSDEIDFQFKGVDSEIYHQLVKHRLNQPIVEDDLVFVHNGRLAMFLDEVEDPWM